MRHVSKLNVMADCFEATVLPSRFHWKFIRVDSRIVPRIRRDIIYTITLIIYWILRFFAIDVERLKLEELFWNFNRCLFWRYILDIRVFQGKYIFKAIMLCRRIIYRGWVRISHKKKKVVKYVLLLYVRKVYDCIKTYNELLSL